MNSPPSAFGPLAPLIAALRVFFFITWILACIPFQMLVIALRLPIREYMPIFFHKMIVHIITGLDVRKVGTISKAKPTLFISNHMSGLDIPVLGSVMPARFVSKSEVAAWPLFGFLAKLQDTVFIIRRGRLAQSQGKVISDALKEKRYLVLFPEGTSTDGSQIKPFKTGLLQVVVDEKKSPVIVQPVSIAIYGKQGRQHAYPWYGDMELVPYIWKIFQMSGIKVRITFHPPFEASRFADRKELAEYAQSQVASAPHGVLALEEHAIGG